VSQDPSAAKLANRLDKLYEFERAPITEDKLHSGRYFAGLFAGEHVAATEFVIGALFVQWGAGARDLILGLIVGNALAVLSWAFICSPIATRTRLTLYWYVRRIIGPGLTVVYNFVNAILYCCLAAAMIGVSASAVFVALSKLNIHLKHPTLEDVLPNSMGWVIVVLAVGAVVIVLAIAGFKKLSQFASICSPWMFMIFIAGALASLPSFGEIRSTKDLSTLARHKIWTGKPYESALRAIPYLPTATAARKPVPQKLRDHLEVPDRNWFERTFNPKQVILSDNAYITEEIPDKKWRIEDGEAQYTLKYAWVEDDQGLRTLRLKIHRVLPRLGFMHIMFFAWFCNLAMHVGLSDMAIFRYAQHWSYGFYSAFGMYLGHFVAWVCAGVMGAAVGRDLNPGEMADNAAGLAGVLAVLIAGWTTANPTIYRAGLALQIITPNWPRWKVTLLAGGITALVGCFPAIFMQLLSFVAIYGLMLMPIGAIIVVEHWVFPKIGLSQYWTYKRKLWINVPAMISWLAVLVICFPIEQFTQGALKSPMELLNVHLFFRWLPGWFIAAGLYIALCKLFAAKLGTRSDGEPDEVVQAAAIASSQHAGDKKPVAKPTTPLTWGAGALALLALIACFYLPLRVFLGGSDPEVYDYNLQGYKSFMIIATLVYFAAAIYYHTQRERSRRSSQ
jgi:purine-cytosine permease-like protein